MTDKQIIYNGPSKNHACDICGAYDCNGNDCRLYQEYEAKEQECEELKKELHKNFEEKDTLHLIIDRLLEASGYDTNTASAEDFEDVYENMRYEKQQLDQLKAENEDLKKSILQHCPNCGEEYLNYKGVELYYKNNDLKQTLAEIKPILEFYANSTLGEEQEDGTYHIELSYKYGYSNMYGAPCYYVYDPRPARQALQKISECEGNNDMENN